MKSRNLFVKIVTGILFSLLILSFAVWGIGDIFRGGGQARVVAKVGEVEIDQLQFSQDLSRQMNQLSQRFGTRIDAEQARNLGIVQQVLSQSISRALFDQRAAELRMIVTDDAVKARLLDDPMFKDQFGSFNRDRFIQVLRITNMSEGAYLDSLRRDMQRQQLVGAVTSAVTPPQVLAEALHAYENERRIADYILVAAPDAANIAEPSATELQAFYDSNSNSYMAPEYRGLSLVQLRPEDVVSESAVDEADIRAEFEARRAEFAVPERRSIEQIVLTDEAAARAASERIAGGVDFATLAEELTGAAPISLGTVARGELLPELGEPAFALEPGVAGTPVRGPLSWHILRVTEIIAGREPEFDEVRANLEADIAMREAVDSMISIANQFDDELAGGAGLEEAAGGAGLRVRRIEAIDSNGLDKTGTAVADVPSLDEFMPVVRETAVGETSLLTETSDGGYFIVRVDTIEDAAPRPLAEIREEAIADWRAGEAMKQAGSRAEALLEQLLRSGNVAALAAAEGLEVKTTEAVTRFENDPDKLPAPQLASQLFQLAVGDTTSLASDAGHIIAELKEIVPADLLAEADQVKQTKAGLGQAIQNDLLEQYLAALRQDYGVSINDAVIDEILNSY